MDSTGFHWTPLDFTGLHYIIETSLHTGTKLDSTGLSATINTNLDSTGLHWTASCILHNTGLDWTGLHCHTQHKTGLHWTGLDSTGLPATFNTLGSLIIQSPSPLPLLQLQDLQLYLICIPHRHLYYPLHLCLYFSFKISSCTLFAYPTNICITILHQSNPYMWYQTSLPTQNWTPPNYMLFC